MSCTISFTINVKSLQEFERFQTAGLIKHLGISNFNEAQVQRLLDNSVAKPEVLQVSKSIIAWNCPPERDPVLGNPLNRLKDLVLSATQSSDGEIVFSQIEMHVYLQQKQLVAFCKTNNVLVTAYSPLGSKGIDKMLQGAGIE